MTIRLLLFCYLFPITSIFSQTNFERDFNKILNYEQQAQYSEAIEIAEQLLDFEKYEDTNPNQKVLVYTKLGMLHRQMGDYTQSTSFIDLAIGVCDVHPNIPAAFQIVVYNERGNTMMAIDEYGKAQKAFDKTIGFFDKLSTVPNSLQAVHINAWTGIAQAYQHKDLVAEAKNAAEKSSEISGKVKNKSSVEFLEQDLKLAILLAQLELSDKAEMAIMQATTALETLEKDNFFQYAKLLQDFSAYYRVQGDYPKALDYNQQALHQYSALFRKDDLYTLPTFEQLNGQVQTELLIESLASKALLHTECYHKMSAQKELTTALDVYTLLDLINNQLRHLYSQEETRLIWSNRVLDFYKEAINVCLLLYDETQDKTYHHQAFMFSERSKCVLLLEAFQNTKAKKIAGVPQEIIEQESQLKTAITDFQNELYPLRRYRKKDATREAKIQELEQNLLHKRKEYDEFIAKVEQEYPYYYQMKYNLEVIDVPAVRAKLLEDNQALIEYFIDDERLIIFKITATDFVVKEVPLYLDLTTLISDFRKDLYAYYLEAPENRSDALFERYWQNYKIHAYQLYEILLQPIEPLPERLVIIPADVIGYLTFEPLLTEKLDNDAKADYQALPYLIQKHAVGYCYSATLLYEMEIKEHTPEKIFLGFAPDFEQEKQVGKYNLPPLQYTQEEVATVQDLVGQGLIYEGEGATKSNFQELCGDYCIVHIATHGVADNQNSNYSFLAFSEDADSADNAFLYVKDLYNMKLSANMVVLSACETGIGELYGSEGIASLARGFAYAGAKSIVTSLWSVNDRSTSLVMKRFYEILNTGARKDDALRQAKLDYIHHQKGEAAHPFFWSAFVQIGDAEPVPSLVPFDKRWLFLIIPASLGLIWAVFRFVRKRNSNKTAIT